VAGSEEHAHAEGGVVEGEEVKGGGGGGGGAEEEAPLESRNMTKGKK